MSCGSKWVRDEHFDFWPADLKKQTNKKKSLGKNKKQTQNKFFNPIKGHPPK